MGVDSPAALAEKYAESIVFRTQAPAYALSMLQRLDERLAQLTGEKEEECYLITT